MLSSPGVILADDTTSSASTTNQPAWLNPVQIPQLTWGPIDFHPHLQAATIFDDNIEFATKNPQSDVLYQVSPGLQIIGGDRSTLRYDASMNYSFDLTKLLTSALVIQSPEVWPDKFFVLDYSPRWQEFSHYTANDSFDQFVTANAEWPFAKLVLGLSEDYSDQKTVIIQSESRNEVRRNLSEVNAGYQANDQLSFDAALQFQDVTYPGATNLFGYTEGKGVVSVNRQIQLFNVSLVGAGGIDQVSGSQNQEFEQFGARLRYQYNELFSLDGSAGGEYRQFESGISSALNPYFTFGATYSPWEQNSIRIAFTRQEFPSLYNGYYYTSTGGGLTVRKSLTDRFTLESKIGYYQFEYTSTSKTGGTVKPSDFYSIQIKGEMRLLKTLSADVFYEFRGSGLSQNNEVLQDNQGGVELALHF